MAITYNSATVDTKAAKLGNPEFRAIGRLIRACAEGENLLNLFLTDMLSLSEGDVLVLLGQTPVSKRLTIAEQISEKRGPEKRSLFDRAFNKDFRESVTIRNVVCHGFLAGKSDEGQWAFMTATADSLDEEKFIFKTLLVTTGALSHYAEEAEKGVIRIEHILGLQERRAARRQRSIRPHSKSQQPRPPSAGRKPPRQS